MLDVMLTALCLTHTPRIPLEAITPLVVASSREFLASAIASQHLPPTGSYYAPFAPTPAPTPLPAPAPPTKVTTESPAPSRSQGRYNYTVASVQPCVE